MKKIEYNAPEMEVIKFGLKTALLGMSGGGEGDPGGLDNPDAPAPEDDY